MSSYLYGLYGDKSSPIFLPIVAQSITAQGRKNITELKKNLEKEGLELVHSDTDSIFIRQKKNSQPIDKNFS